MIREVTRATVILLVAALIGCSGGSGGDSSSSTTPAPSGEVLPSNFDFGTVTTGNNPAPLQVRIKNNGSAALRVSGITLSDLTNFSINPNGGTKPCGSTSPAIAAADYCTFEVGFQPGTDGSFAAGVQIASNNSSALALALSGIAEAVKTLTVRINQLETSCPLNGVTAHVSVTDQGGYSLLGLTGANFTVTEVGMGLLIGSANYVETVYEKIAIAAAMDYSGSIAPERLADIQNGLISLFDNLRATDMGEVIKFGTGVEVTQTFTSDKTALSTAVLAPFTNNNDTYLYDAAFKAVDDTAAMAGFRKAVIILTDGFDHGSTHNLNDVINNAISKGVPIFTVGVAGIGEGGVLINTTILEPMASETGGQYFEAETTQNLATIYQQLSSILYEKQYILTFNQQALGAGNTANLTIRVNSNGVIGDDTRLITSCN